MPVRVCIEGVPKGIQVLYGMDRSQLDGELNPTVPIDGSYQVLEDDMVDDKATAQAKFPVVLV